MYGAVQNMSEITYFAYANSATNVPFGTPDYANAVQISSLESNTSAAVAQCNAGEYIKLVWLPQNDLDVNFYEITMDAGNIFFRDQVFVFAVIGLTASTGGGAIPINLDIYVNYELLPQAGSTLTGMEEANTTPGDGLQIVNTIRRTMPKVIAQTCTAATGGLVNQ